MIISTKTGKEDFDRLVEVLLANSERPNRAHFAVGSCHSSEAEGEDIRKAMQKADARMYEVKAKYYFKHPELQWHNKIV